MNEKKKVQYKVGRGNRSAMAVCIGLSLPGANEGKNLFSSLKHNKL